MRIIDFHNHIYPDAIAQKATKSIEDFYELEGGHMSGTVENLLDRGGKAGITEYVVLPVGLKPSHVRHINEFVISQVDEHPQFTGFGTVHAGMDDLTDEVQFIMDSGLKGIKMHPDTQLFNIDDERLFPMYEMAQGKLLIMPHMGDSRYDYSHPRRLKRVLELFPRLEVVATHFGGYSVYETAFDNLNHTNCVFDVSSSLMFMDEGVAEKYIRAYGAERFVYGTDFPLWDPVTEMERFRRLKLTDSEFEAIYWRNAARVLNIP